MTYNSDSYYFDGTILIQEEADVENAIDIIKQLS